MAPYQAAYSCEFNLVDICTPYSTNCSTSFDSDCCPDFASVCCGAMECCTDDTACINGSCTFRCDSDMNSEYGGNLQFGRVNITNRRFYTTIYRVGQVYSKFSTQSMFESGWFWIIFGAITLIGVSILVFKTCATEGVGFCSGDDHSEEGAEEEDSKKLSEGSGAFSSGVRGGGRGGYTTVASPIEVIYVKAEEELARVDRDPCAIISDDEEPLVCSLYSIGASDRAEQLLVQRRSMSQGDLEAYRLGLLASSPHVDNDSQNEEEEYSTTDLLSDDNVLLYDTSGYSMNDGRDISSGNTGEAGGEIDEKTYTISLDSIPAALVVPLSDTHQFGVSSLSSPRSLDEPTNFIADPESSQMDSVEAIGLNSECLHQPNLDPYDENNTLEALISNGSTPRAGRRQGQAPIGHHVQRPISYSPAFLQTDRLLNSTAGSISAPVRPNVPPPSYVEAFDYPKPNQL